MNAPLAPTDRQRLVKLLGLLGSDFDGEVASAGRLADKLVRTAGLTWPDVLTPALPPPAYQSQCQQPSADPASVWVDWRQTVAACLRYPLLINRWENEFLTGLWRFPRLSRKQRETMVNIVLRLRAAGCAI